MKKFINGNKVIRHSNAVAAGSTDITPTGSIDTKGCRRATFIAELGAIISGAVTGVRVQQSDDNAVADDYTDLTGTALAVADDDDNGVAIVEILEPQKRYLKMIVDRATQNATLEGITVILSEPDSEPVTQDATVLGSEFHQSPAEGTA